MGSAFAAQEFGVTPDVITMAKATTNGVVPMGAVAVKEEIYNAVMDASPKGAVELFHGYTYSGIPIATAPIGTTPLVVAFAIVITSGVTPNS